MIALARSPARLPDVIVVNSFRYPPISRPLSRGPAKSEGDLGGASGFTHSSVGRNTDDPELWVLTTEWESVRAYRRALSAYDVSFTLSRC